MKATLTEGDLPLVQPGSDLPPTRSGTEKGEHGEHAAMLVG